MKIIDTLISGVKIIENQTLGDERGEFSRIFCSKELESCLSGKSIKQINRSKTKKIGAIRGIHYQNSPYAEIKIIRCLKGRVFDVAVDLRKNSDTFLKWVSLELSPEKNISFILPEGCAHGFQVLEEDSELLYFHSAPYTPHAEGALRFDDPLVNIKWPLPITEISQRDLSHLHLNFNFEGLAI
jgi:dTDP-4-dehydrorhamnose 3,5-epimerase